MVLDEFRLDGKVAVAVGASRGLGKGMALALAQAGATVVCVSRSKDAVDATSEQIKKMGGRSLALAADVSKVPECDRVIDTVVKQLGRVDILLNAAGVQARKPALEMTEQDWETVVGTQLKAVFFASQVAAKAMIKQGEGGKIINIASLTSQVAIPNVSIYAACKGGIVQLTKSFALEWAPYGIRVNAIGPGYYKTEMTAVLWKDPATVQKLVEHIPLGRTGVPEDLAGTVVFLASKASDYITGQVIYVDGGWLAKGL